MNNLPYYFSETWKKYEIDYLKFNNYNFIKDLSYEQNSCKSIILLFEYEGKNILRGYSDGIVFPQINYFDINNIHIKKKGDKIQKIFNYINEIFKEYNIVDTKIYQDPYLCYSLGYSIFDLIDIDNFKLKYKIEMYVNYESNVIQDKIENYMEGGGARTIINGFKKNIPNVNIYFGEINDETIESFKNKHIELSGKKTKDDICWELTKQLIINKEGLLLENNNNFILFLISDNYSYYAINACTKRDKIVTFLLYEGIKWLNNNNYKYIHFGTFYKYYNDEKNINISKFKKSFCNKMFNQYYLVLK
jgi:hypothetical protein